MKKALMALSLLSVSLSQMTSANETQKPFPQNLYGGYWAVTEPVGDDFEYIVVNFYEKKGVIYSDSHRFYCTGNDYQHFKKTTGIVTQSSDKLLLKESVNAPTLLVLELVDFVPSKSLVLHQTAPDNRPDLQKRFPAGIMFSYQYTPTLKPEC